MAARTNIKMGSLNLLIMVISISLAVLSVLSIVTAMASKNLTSRQSETTIEAYLEDSAAQNFLSYIDNDLERVRNGSTNARMALASLSATLPGYIEDALSAVDIADTDDIVMAGEAKTVTLDELLQVVRIREDTYDTQGDDWVIDTGAFEEPEGETSFWGALPTSDDLYVGNKTGSIQDDPDFEPIFDEDSVTYTSAEEKTSVHIENLASTCVGGISATFSTESGRILNCLIGVRDDGTYVIVRWQSSRSWGSEDAADAIWLGD